VPSANYSTSLGLVIVPTSSNSTSSSQDNNSDTESFARDAGNSTANNYSGWTLPAVPTFGQPNTSVSDGDTLTLTGTDLAAGNSPALQGYTRVGMIEFNLDVDANEVAINGATVALTGIGSASDVVRVRIFNGPATPGGNPIGTWFFTGTEAFLSLDSTLIFDSGGANDGLLTLTYDFSLSANTSNTVGVTLTGVSIDSTGGVDSVVINSGGSSQIAIAAAPAPISPGDLVITEIMYDSAFDGEPGGEWIEVFNRSGSPIDLRDYIIDDTASGGSTASALSAGTVIPSGSYAVIGAGGGTDVPYSFIAWSWPALNNTGGDAVNLYYLDGATLIDNVTYERGANNWPDPAAGQSIIFTGDPAAAAAVTQNNDGNRWKLSTVPISATNTDLGSPGLANFKLASGLETWETYR